MGVRAVITLLCGVGLYASLFMLAKARRAARGELEEPSVVQTARARLFGGLPNALIGAIYYLAMGLGVWWARGPLEVALLAAALLAAGTSLALAYSLLFVTRRACPYCWTGHLVNWTLLALCLWIFLPDVLSMGMRFW